MKMNKERFKAILDRYYSHYPRTKFVLAVDFDHTLCNSHYPFCDDEIRSVCDFIRSIQDFDYIQIITTCRDGNASVNIAKEWLANHNIRWDYFNENDPERIELYQDCRKIYCDMLIDDTSYNFNKEDFE